LQGSKLTTFIDVFKDEVLEQQLESLVGTLKAARTQKKIECNENRCSSACCCLMFLQQGKGQMLLQGAHDKTEIRLLKDFC
jgi:hypothetical protein